MTRYRYRVTVFNNPRSEWRDTYEQAKDDAIAAGLASYDESLGEYFIAVPVSIEKQKLS
ncbi:hypothetical protein ACWGNZ_07145 [Sphingomonas zeae]